MYESRYRKAYSENICCTSQDDKTQILESLPIIRGNVTEVSLDSSACSFKPKSCLVNWHKRAWRQELL